MATLTGKTIANTYKDLLQVSNDNNGVDGTMRTVSDGEGTNTALQLSNAGVNINGTFELNGEAITVNASAINNMADIGSATGIIAVNSGNVYGRTLTAGTPVSITNADGTAGNPTITLASIASVSGSYGPLTNFAVNDYGQIVSATAVSTSVSIPTIRASELVAETLTLSSNASIVGDLNVDGAFIVDGIVSAESDFHVGGSLFVSQVSAALINTSFISATDFFAGTLSFTAVSVSAFTANQLTVVSSAEFGGNVSAVAYYGDGSNLTNLPGATSVSAFTVNQLTIVSAATLAGTDLGTKITALETSIGTANTRITSVSDFAVALSSTMATSIGNSNTNITTNINAITSVNTVLANTSSALATSIGTANTRITSVSDFAVALSATMATSVGNHLPLAGGTLTGKVINNYNSSTRMPVGTTLERDGSPAVGDFRYNSTTGEFEGYAGSSPAWGGIGAGAGYFKGDNGTVGSSAGDIFRINEAALDADVTITSTENGSATGPLTVSSGITLTVEGTLVII